MNDLINRQAAIGAIDAQTLTMYQNVKKGATYPKKEWFGGMANACEIIKALPSAEPEWIPVSERLPEIKEHHVSDVCLVCLKDHGMAFAELQENIFGQVGWDVEREDEYHDPIGEVVAWMPLPNPYEENHGQQGID